MFLRGSYDHELGFFFQGINRGLPTRMVYLYYISCLRYTILVGNPGNTLDCFDQVGI